jgi:hypothetical protein
MQARRTPSAQPLALALPHASGPLPLARTRLSAGALTPRTPECASPLLPVLNTNRKSSDSWGSYDSAGDEPEREWDADHTLFLTRVSPSPASDASNPLIDASRSFPPVPITHTPCLTRHFGLFHRTRLLVTHTPVHRTHRYTPLTDS